MVNVMLPYIRKDLPSSSALCSTESASVDSPIDASFFTTLGLVFVFANDFNRSPFSREVAGRFASAFVAGVTLAAGKASVSGTGASSPTDAACAPLSFLGAIGAGSGFFAAFSANDLRDGLVSISFAGGGGGGCLLSVLRFAMISK
jgi:hypothetical protein